MVLLLALAGYAFSETVNEMGRLPATYRDFMDHLANSDRIRRNVRAMTIFAFVISLILVGAFFAKAGLAGNSGGSRVVGLAALIVLMPVLFLRIASGILSIGDAAADPNQVPAVGLLRLVSTGGWAPNNLGNLRKLLLRLQVFLLILVAMTLILRLIGQ